MPCLTASSPPSARLRLPGANPATDTDRARLQFIASVCNGVACGTLRAALDFIEPRPLEELQQDDEFLSGLTYLEQQEEARLTEEHAAYRHTIDDRRAGVDGGFNKSWTFWAGTGGDREAAGIGAA